MDQRYSNILVVDDDLNHLKTLKTIIKSWGYEVETAKDGQEAVEMVRQRPFSLILMDVRMSKMSGIDALKEIKKIQSRHSHNNYDCIFLCGISC